MAPKFGSFSEFDNFVDQISAALWSESRTLRSQMNHGVHPCPQRNSPFDRRSVETSLCAPCTELHTLHLVTACRRLALAGIEPVRNNLGRIEAFVRKHCRHSILEARDLLQGQLGLTQRIERLHDRQWFVEALPDPIDREIIIQVIYFLRSGDDTGGVYGDLPVPLGRIADRLGIGLDEGRRRLSRAIDALFIRKPAFTETNILAPLSERLGQQGDEWASGA